MIARIAQNRVRRTYRGGSRIDAFTGCVRPDDGELRPEDWTASTTQAFNGAAEIEGEGLGRLEDGRCVKDAVGPLPILVKLLDADERLVIQAHPTVPCAKRLFGSPVGKTECWCFLPGTSDDACVYLGFKPGMTRERWRDAILGGVQCPATGKERVHPEPLSFLHRIPVSAGDFVFVDGGMPHAIGAGCFMVELQEPSDLMVVAERFTPSGRRIPDAKMHGGIGWDRMFDVYEYEGIPFDDVCARYVRRAFGRKEPDGTGVDRRCRRICGPGLTDKFEMWHLCGGAELPLRGAAAVSIVTCGAGAANGVQINAGDRFLAAEEDALILSGDVEVIVCK